MVDEKGKEITISESLYNKIKNRLPKTEFSTVSDYIEYIVREVLNSLEEEEEKKVFTKDEEKEIEQRLRDLGYID
ncbi:MAG: CopG family transcriptional regulator [Promethearchaeota archaeon]